MLNRWTSEGLNNDTSEVLISGTSVAIQAQRWGVLGTGENEEQGSHKNNVLSRSEAQRWDKQWF